ncbi:MAG: MipA/OmpV family protein, partial [Anaerolineae bacterium]
MTLPDRRRVRGGAVLVLAALLPGAAWAQEVFRTPFEEVPSGTPAIGGAGLVRPRTYIGEGDGYSSDLVPLYLYEGERVFSHGTEFGVHVLDSDRMSMDVVGRYRFSQLRPAELGLEGIEPRDQTLEAGVSLSFGGAWGRLSGAWLADTLGHHDGQTAEISYGFPMHFRRLSVTPWLSYEWQSAELASYYFQVTAAEDSQLFHDAPSR